MSTYPDPRECVRLAAALSESDEGRREFTTDTRSFWLKTAAELIEETGVRAAELGLSRKEWTDAIANRLRLLNLEAYIRRQKMV